MSAPTIREIHERCKARHSGEDGLHCCAHCGHAFPCPDFEDAVAALDALDAAVRVEHFPEGWCEVSDSHPLDTCRVVPDPSPPPRSDAPTPKEDT